MRQWMRAHIARGRAIQAAIVVVGCAALAIVLVARLVSASHAVPRTASGSLVGHLAPDFTITTWNGAPGQQVRLSALRGHPVVLNFWAAWCQPCQEEMPLLQTAWQQYHTSGVMFVGVALDTQQPDGMQFLRSHGVAYPCGPDPTHATAPAYGLIGLPTTVIIDRHGIVVEKLNGQLTPHTLAQAMIAVLSR